MKLKELKENRQSFVIMKFAEHLTAHITPEWRKQYICYEVKFLIKIFLINLHYF